VTDEPSPKFQNETGTVRFLGVAAFPIRLATTDDVPELRRLIAQSVRELQKDDYSAEQLALAVETVFTLDTLLIADGTYFVIEDPAPVDGVRIVACGGWSRRSTLCGGDLHAVRDDSFLDPRTNAAKIRAFFVHPRWARRGLASRLLQKCEQAAQAAGFTRFEMAATLTGVPLYKARGYHAVERTSVPLCGSSILPVVIMARSILGPVND
jgi:GNAT superfamily N-acetyltransferase